MKKMLTLFILLFLLSCKSENPISSLQEKSMPKTWTILLDLSDRILEEECIEDDLKLLRAILDSFAELVKRQNFVFAKDEIRFLIAPQRGIPYSFSEEAFQIKMEDMPIAEKHLLPQLLDSIYVELEKLFSAARFSEKKTDYAGADIWRWLNDNSENYFDNAADNRLFILTDGYLAFERTSMLRTIDNLSSGTSFISEAASQKEDWENWLKEKKFGVLKVTGLHKTKIVVAQLSPYKIDYQKEAMQYVWNDWLHNKCDAKEVKLFYKGGNSIGMIKKLLKNDYNNYEKK